MNAVFGYRSSVTIGENLIVGVVTGTAVCLSALPRPNKQTTSWFCFVFDVSFVVLLINTY